MFGIKVRRMLTGYYVASTTRGQSVRAVAYDGKLVANPYARCRDGYAYRMGELTALTREAERSR